MQTDNFIYADRRLIEFQKCTNAVMPHKKIRMIIWSSPPRTATGPTTLSCINTIGNLEKQCRKYEVVDKGPVKRTPLIKRTPVPNQIKERQHQTVRQSQPEKAIEQGWK